MSTSAGSFTLATLHQRRAARAWEHRARARLADEQPQFRLQPLARYVQQPGITMAVSNDSTNPKWWNETHTSAWERSKAALRRDWEQTKADVSDRGKELNQGADDTVKQALGKEPIPPGNQPNAPDSWEHAEPALRYGYGARHYYAGKEWDDELEGKLKEDWDHTTHSGSSWERFKSAVRRGWDAAKNAAT